MKRSDLNKFIKENIIETLSESSSSEEKRIALRAVKSIAKYRNVSEDEAKRDLINAVKELGSIKEADVDIEIPSIARQKANAKITNAKGFAQFILKAWNDISNEESESITSLQDLKIAKAKLEKVAKAEEEISEQLPSKEEVEDTTAAVQNLKKELDSLEEDDDIDDKDAVAQANKARGKHKKLDIAVKAKKALETEMKSLARKYSAADDVEKEKIKDDLKAKTAKKKELESLVAKLEKDVV
jgi:hypothetical protein